MQITFKYSWYIKWNINFDEEAYISSFNSNSISIKEIKSESLLSEEIIKNSNILEDSSSSKDNNNIQSLETENYLDNSKNEEIDDYYDNFYN